MTDIVERLRSGLADLSWQQDLSWAAQAANEIERLRASERSAWNAAVERDEQIERLRSQLPAEMQDCTIIFKECEKGHGRLTATNWVQHECQTCEIERFRSAYAGACVEMHGFLMDCGLTDRGFGTAKDWRDKAKAEIERLRAEVAHWKEARQMALDGGDLLKRVLDAAARERDRLRAEVAECKKDAERYRWLRQYMLKADDTTFTFRPSVHEATPALVDEAIDAALKEGK